MWAPLGEVELELVALVAQMVPLGSWLADPPQLGPLVLSKRLCRGRAGSPWAWWAQSLARGSEPSLAVLPARVKQRSAFSSLQPAEGNVQRALIREKQRAGPEFPQDFLAFSSLLGADEVPVSIPWVLSLTPSPFSLQRARPGGGHLRLRALRG